MTILHPAATTVTPPLLFFGGGAGVAIGKRATILDSTLSFNGFGVSAGGVPRSRVELDGSTLEGNEYGIANIRKAVVTNSPILDSDYLGIAAIGVRVEQSTVTGSGHDPECGGTVLCADIAAHKLRADAVTCDTSVKLDYPSSNSTGETWGVCSLD